MALFLHHGNFISVVGFHLLILIYFKKTEDLGGGGVHPYITYTGMCRPTGSWFWSSWFRTGYPFQRRFLERGIIFRMHESSSFVSSHLKLFKDRLLLKIRFNVLASKLLYSFCTLCAWRAGIFSISRSGLPGISFRANSRTGYKKLVHF